MATGLNSKDYNPLESVDQNLRGLYEGNELAKTHNKFGEVLPGLSPASGAYIGSPSSNSFNQYQFPTNGEDPNLGLSPESSPMTGLSQPIQEESLGNQDYISMFDQYQPPSTTSDSSGFQGFNQAQMRTDGSFAGLGAGVGALAGGPVGSAVGGVAGTAVDMYMNYQANEERKRAERQRLEEARRQQQFANRQADRDRALQAQQYGDAMGFRNAQEDRTQQGFDVDMKQKRVNMLRDAMANSLKTSDTVRNIFAKRGVV